MVLHMSRAMDVAPVRAACTKLQPVIRGAAYPRGAAEGAMTQPHGLGPGAVDRRSIIDGYEGRFGRRRIHQ